MNNIIYFSFFTGRCRIVRVIGDYYEIAHGDYAQSINVPVIIHKRQMSLIAHISKPQRPKDSRYPEWFRYKLEKLWYENQTLYDKICNDLKLVEMTVNNPYGDYTKAVMVDIPDMNMKNMKKNTKRHHQNTMRRMMKDMLV